MKTYRGIPKSKNNLILYLQGKDVMLVNKEGYCVASSDPQKVGRRIDLPQATLKNYGFEKSSGHNISIGSGKKKKFILILRKKDSILTPEHISYINGLAKLTIQQYLETNTPPKAPIDQFIVKILNEPFNLNRMHLYEQEAKSLGLDLEKKRVALLLSFDNFLENQFLEGDGIEIDREEIIQNWKRKISESIRGFFTKNNDIITAYLGNSKFVVYKSIPEFGEEVFLKHMRNAYEAIFGSLEETSSNSLTVGFGDAHQSVKGLIEAYKEAEMALEIGKRLSKSNNKSHYFGDLGSLRILLEEDKDKKLKYANEILDILDGQELQTLQRFFEENLSVKDTASKMNIHPNTVIYRLQKIGTILGLDPRNFNEANAIKIALLTRRILT